MKNLTQAIRLSLKYKWSILGSVVSSLIIAFLFCISISALFPVIKIVLEGETASIWIAKEVKDAKIQKIEFVEELDDLQKQFDAANPDQQRQMKKQLALAKHKVDAETRAVARYEFLQPYVDQIAPSKPFTTLVAAMVFLLITAVLKGIFLVLSTVLVSRVANATVMDMRRIYYCKILELDQSRIEHLGTSQMMVHLSNNMNMVSSSLRALYGKSLREPFKMVACLFGAAMISLPLLLLSMIVIPAGAIVIHNLTRRMKKSVQKELGGMREVFQTLIETLNWLKTVRIFNRESTERKRFKENAGVMYQMSMRISMYDSLLRPITEVLGIIAIALSILAGSYLVLNQATTLFGFRILDRPLEPSMLILFYGFLAGASDPARKMSEIVNLLVRGDTACGNLAKHYSTSVDEEDVHTNAVPLHRRSIEFRNLTFEYKPGQPVLHDLNLTVPYGQAVAIVGGNGCGKSTLMNLLARFYEVKQGKILLDGVDIGTMNPKRLRRQIAWVTQQSVLFKGTIAENIAYGKRNATHTEILDAARVAHVTEFLPNLENGIETEVGDNGSLLSAGQRQRVALARAILADPEILILDEATSQMDGKTERKIHEALSHYIKDRTTFIVTHRASSLSLADRVIVMENGEIVHDDDLAATREQSEHFQFLFAKSA